MLLKTNWWILNQNNTMDESGTATHLQGNRISTFYVINEWTVLIINQSKIIRHKIRNVLAGYMIAFSQISLLLFPFPTTFSFKLLVYQGPLSYSVSLLVMSYTRFYWRDSSDHSIYSYQSHGVKCRKISDEGINFFLICDLCVDK